MNLSSPVAKRVFDELKLSVEEKARIDTTISNAKKNEDVSTLDSLSHYQQGNIVALSKVLIMFGCKADELQNYVKRLRTMTMNTAQAELEQKKASWRRLNADHI